MPRSAFLDGAREAGGTKTYSGAIVKQKTAVPQGATSLSLAVLESDGRKGSSDKRARDDHVGRREVCFFTSGDGVNDRASIGSASGSTAR